MQDINWPVAREVARVLSPHTNDIKDELLEILRGSDGDWKYWCILYVIGPAPVPRLADELLAELRRIADLPSRGEQEPEPIEEARALWEEWSAKLAG